MLDYIEIVGEIAAQTYKQQTWAFARRLVQLGLGDAAEVITALCGIASITTALLFGAGEVPPGTSLKVEVMYRLYALLMAVMGVAFLNMRSKLSKIRKAEMKNRPVLRGAKGTAAQN